MTKAADDFASRAKKATARNRAKPADTTLPPAPPRIAPVRLGADLAPNSYRALLAYCARVAENSGRGRVPYVEVLRALVDHLTEDTDLQTVIEAEIRRRHDNA